MKQIVSFPPNYKHIVEHFPWLKPEDKVVFTYGDTIYNPTGGYIDEALIAHEEVHEKQQEYWGIERWWDQYCGSKEFRISQEVPAYQAQYQFAKNRINDKRQLKKYVKRLAMDLAGPMYGYMTTYDKAYDAIKNG